jgi:hypothetical protein
MAGPGGDDIAADPLPPTILIANEFADVVVRRVCTRNGVRLEISSPRRGTTVRLDAVVLEALTWQEPELFTSLLRDRPTP